MKKLFLPLILVMLIALAFSFTAGAAGIGITIDNELVAFNSDMGAPFIDSSSRTQVPFRATMEKFGCQVSWDADTKSAVAIKDDITVTVPIGQKYIFRNGVKITNDTAALIKDNRTYLPIRAVLEAFGASVGWDSSAQRVVVHTIPAPTMTIHYIDVGQGDAIFIDFDDYEILIDAGDNGSGYDVVNYIDSYVDGDLEIIVATHAHEDHIGGLDDVIEAFQVDNIIDNGEIGTTITYNEY